jgi:hypothetical protein
MQHTWLEVINFPAKLPCMFGVFSPVIWKMKYVLTFDTAESVKYIQLNAVKPDDEKLCLWYFYYSKYSKYQWQDTRLHMTYTAVYLAVANFDFKKHPNQYTETANGNWLYLHILITFYHDVFLILTILGFQIGLWILCTFVCVLSVDFICIIDRVWSVCTLTYEDEYNWISSQLTLQI